MTKRKLPILLAFIVLALCLVPLHALAIDPPTLTLEEDTGINGDGITENGTMLVGSLETGATWEYSINQGTSWTTGSGTSFVLDDATYPIGYIQVRQTNAGETSTETSNTYEIVVAGNMIDNGDFQQGNTKFTTDYIYNLLDGSGNLTEGGYQIVHDPNDVHGGFCHANDHTYGTYAEGILFVANASGDTSDVVWQSTSAITVEANVEYRFEAYLMSLTNDTNVAYHYPYVRFQIGDGTDWTDIDTTDVDWEPDEEGIWHVTYADGTFDTAGTFYVRMLNDQATGWNDLGLDDIYFGLRGAAPSASDPTTNPTADPPSFPTGGLLSISLNDDTGASDSDKITNNGQVDVNGLNSPRNWQYSIDGGTLWTTGSTTYDYFTVSGDGDKSVIVRQWNTDTSSWSEPTAPLEFTLDTAAPAFSSGTADGASITIAFDETLNSNDPPTPSDFIVTLDSSTTVPVLSLNISGDKITLALQSSVESASYIRVVYVQTQTEPAVTDIAGNENTAFSFELYAVKYNANNATSGSTPETQYKNTDIALVLSGNTGSLERTGYSFDDWNTESNGNGTAYIGGNSYTANAPVTLYADWDANVHMVTYDENNATDGTAPNAQTYGYEQTVTASSNNGGLIRSGLAFGGWNTAADGTGTTYAEGAQFLMPNHDVTLYARWVAIEIPQTGDNSHTSLWIILAAFALIGLVPIKRRLRNSSPPDR